MVTNPIQCILTKYGELFVRMKDREVSLNSIINTANNARSRQGINQIELRDYVRSNSFVSIVLATEVKLGLRTEGDTTGLKVEYKPNGEIMRYNLSGSPLVRTTRGGQGGGGTFVHPFIAIDAASTLDKSLAVDLYEILMTSPIFQLREEGGDLYKELYDTILQLAGSEGRVPAKVQLLARVIAARCGVPIRVDNTTWNYATAEQLQVRHALQTNLIFTARNNCVRDFQAMLELAATGWMPGFPNLPQANLAEIAKEKVVVLNALEQRFAA